MLNWPGIEVINRVVEEFPENPEGFVGQDVLPMNVLDYAANGKTIQWDIRGPALGMVPAHSLNSDPTLMEFPVVKTKTMPTAYWSGFHRIGEGEILNIRRLGTFGERMARGLVVEGLNATRSQVRARVEYLRWQALQGTVTVNENGVKFTVSYEIPNANKVDVSTGSGKYWTNVDADPIRDLQAATELLRGSGAGDPICYFNRKVAGYLSQNAKVRELVTGSPLVTSTGVKQIGDLMLPLVGDLGRMVQYDKGYRSIAGVWTPYIPDNKVILVGQGPVGEKLGEFASTPNLHNGGLEPMPGEFYKPIDKTGEANPYYDILGGVYGMPVIFHPDWIVVLTIAAA
jgi:hypothetical protein